MKINRISPRKKDETSSSEFFRVIIFRLTLLPVVSLVALSLISQAQTAKIKKAGSSSSHRAGKVENSPMPDLQTALDHLQSAADQLKNISKMEERLKLAESLVKLLAGCDSKRCCRMLDSLFDDAITAKEQSLSEKKEIPFDPDATIIDIIKIAASFDRKLAETYLNKYLLKQENIREDIKGTRFTSQELYLKMALSLVEKDPELAVSVAKRAIGAINYDLLTFLGALRRKDARLSSAFFAETLQNASARQLHNVNEMALLYTYLFSPLRVAHIDQKGIHIMQVAGYSEVAENYAVDSSLARQYLQTAARMLSNPDRYRAGNAELLVEGIIGDFYFAGMVQPQAAIYLPEAEETLASARNFLRNNLQVAEGLQPEAAIDRWNNLRADSGAESAKSLGSADYYGRLAERATNPNQKDRFYYFAAMAAVKERQPDLALDMAGKMSDKRRDQARNFITYQLALQFAQEGEYLKAEDMARKDEDLTRRAYILTWVALSFVEGKNKDEARVAEYLNEIEKLSTKIDSVNERVSVLFGAAEVFAQFDTIRAYEVLREGIRTANEIKDFTGSTYIARLLDTGGFYFVSPMYDDKFSFINLIDRLATKDFNETILQVQELKEPLPRIKATIATCQKVMPKD